MISIAHGEWESFEVSMRRRFGVDRDATDDAYDDAYDDDDDDEDDDDRTRTTN